MSQENKFIPHLVHKVPESFYDVLGNLVEPHKKFPVRDEMIYGDSILVVKGNKSFIGIVHSFETINAKINFDFFISETYCRYVKIDLFLNNKKISIDRSRGVLYDTELEVYYSRVVLVEKWKVVELKEIKYF